MPVCYEGLCMQAPASGTASAESVRPQVSDHLWFKGLPFPGRVPWADLVFVLPEDFAAADLRMIANAPLDLKERKRRAMRAHLQDVSWTVPGSRVADNVVSEAARYCM